MQPPDQLGGLDVHRVLVFEAALLQAHDEAELLDVLGQIGQLERGGFAGVAVEKLEGLEVTQQLESRAIRFFQGIEILASLFPCPYQVAPRRFLFNEQDTGPEQVDET